MTKIAPSIALAPSGCSHIFNQSTNSTNINKSCTSMVSPMRGDGGRFEGRAGILLAVFVGKITTSFVKYVSFFDCSETGIGHVVAMLCLKLWC